MRDAKVRQETSAGNDNCHVFRIDCDELRDDGSGGMIEAPKLLRSVESLRDRIARYLQLDATQIPIVAYFGRYEFELPLKAIHRDLIAEAVGESPIILALRDAQKILEANSRSATPQTPHDMGLTESVLSIQDALSQIRALGTSVAVQEPGRSESAELPSVSRDILSAVAREPRKPERLTGIVTGVCVEDDGVRIEVNRGIRVAVIGMTLDAAIPHLRRKTEVSGRLLYVEARPILENHSFFAVPEQPPIS